MVVTLTYAEACEQLALGPHELDFWSQYDWHLHWLFSAEAAVSEGLYPELTFEVEVDNE